MTPLNYTLLPAPNTLQFVDWAALAAELMAAYGVGPPTTELEWRAWANGVLNAGLPGPPVPNPAGFAEWRPWAEALAGLL